jgi:hypothetical protein
VTSQPTRPIRLGCWTSPDRPQLPSWASPGEGAATPAAGGPSEAAPLSLGPGPAPWVRQRGPRRPAATLTAGSAGTGTAGGPGGGEGAATGSPAWPPRRRSPTVARRRPAG